MTRETLIFALAFAVLAYPGHAITPGDEPPPPPPVEEPEPPRDVPEGEDSITTPHQPRAWDICCPLPNGQTLIKVAGNLDRLRPLAVLQCEAVVQSRAVCTDRQQKLGRK